MDKLNKLEQMSILTAATTIYCGLLYLTDDMGEGMKLILFAFILISNAVFFFAWLYGIWEAVAILVSGKYPKISKRFCFWFLKSRKFRTFASTLGVDTRLFEVELGPDPEGNTTTIIES